ncbi:MAG: c-type cytochrome [Bauldia sp.]|nr:c-type cytochrome [Bauldia sp.]
MKRAAALGIAVSLSAAAALAQSDPLGLGLPEPAAREEGDPVRGQAIALGGPFEDLGRVSCAQCHGIDGTGDDSGAFPRLAGQGAFYLYEALNDFATGARPNEVMSPIAAQLSDTDRRDVAAYFAAIEDAAYPAPRDANADLLQRGGALAAIGGIGGDVPACDSCHGAQGAGVPPVYPTLGGQHEAYLVQQLELFRSGERGSDALGVMRAIAALLSDDDIAAVAAYYASVRPEPSP